MSPIFGAPRGDLPKKRRGVRIGERKYATICNELPFFANGDTLVSCAQLIENKRVMPFHGRVVSVGFFSFLNRRSLAQIQSGMFLSLEATKVYSKNRKMD